MRVPVFVLTGLLTTGAMAGAQTTPAGKAGPANPPATSPKLDNHLLRWEQEMKKVNTLWAAITRIDKDKSFGSSTKLTGGAKYMKVGNGATTLNLALLELKQEGKADFAEKVVCTGTYLYQFFPPQKEIRAYEMPKPKPGQVSEDGFLGLLFGMKADEAKKRFVLKMGSTANAPNGEDAHWIYVDIVPRFPADKSDFTRAQLVLSKETFLPRRLWFEHPNGNEVTWDIPTIKTGVELNRREFDAPKPQEGWKLVPVTRGSANAPAAAAPGGANPPPRLIRPSGK
jgi:TIGR03009 family protein